MNASTRVFNKLSTEVKTELTTHKIELGLIDDLKSDANNFKKLSENLDDYTRTIINAQGGLSKGIDKVISKSKSIKKSIETLESKLKELGVDKVPKIVQNIKNSISESIRKASRYEKDFL